MVTRLDMERASYEDEIAQLKSQLAKSGEAVSRLLEERDTLRHQVVEAAWLLKDYEDMAKSIEEEWLDDLSEEKSRCRAWLKAYHEGQRA